MALFKKKEKKTWEWKAVILIIAGLVNVFQTICNGKFLLLTADILLIFSFIYIIERSIKYKIAKKNGYERRSIRKDTIIGFYFATVIWTLKMIVMQKNEIEILFF